LAQWGIDVAEKLGLPIYLESTVDSAPFFEATGFKKLENKTLAHTASALGAKEDIVVPLMVRMPSKANGMSFEEWQDKRFPSW
jgi:hypothetical protein